MAKSTVSAFVCILAIIITALQYIPIQYALPQKYVANRKQFEPNDIQFYDDFVYEYNITASYQSIRKYPLIIQQGDTAINLTQWVTNHLSWINDKLKVHGVILFRGFTISTPQNFESVSIALEPNLEQVYLGTSPRKLQPNCKYVHSASEFPDWRIIPSHCEMSFLLNPPSRQFFYAHEPNLSPGGETPVTSFSL